MNALVVAGSSFWICIWKQNLHKYSREKETPLDGISEPFKKLDRPGVYCLSNSASCLEESVRSSSLCSFSSYAVYLPRG